nr:unnamed protein product [Spirometra erinaceieuropaei]
MQPPSKPPDSRCLGKRVACKPRVSQTSNPDIRSLYSFPHRRRTFRVRSAWPSISLDSSPTARQIRLPPPKTPPSSPANAATKMFTTTTTSATNVMGAFLAPDVPPSTTNATINITNPRDADDDNVNGHQHPHQK